MHDESARLRPTVGSPIAPRWHVAVLVGLIVAVALTGTLLAMSSSRTPAPAPRGDAIAVFAQILLVQGLLVTYVARVGWGRWRLREMIGAGWTSAGRAAGDTFAALVVVGVIVAVESAWTSSVAARNAATDALLPHSSSEIAAWLFVALVVGVSEEVVYRGYLQPQLAARAGSTIVGMAASAVLFGMAHLQQGPAAAARAGVYGLLLGLVAHRRRSLIPGMLAHVAIDSAAGLLPR